MPAFFVAILFGVILLFWEFYEKTCKIKGFVVLYRSRGWKLEIFFHKRRIHFVGNEESTIMAAKKTAATKETPVQTEEIVKVEETVKVEKKPAARKAKAEKTETEVAEKKTTKRTTKKAVKTTYVVQAAGKEVSMEDATAKVKEAWVAEGNKEADLKEITLYVKPEENAIYYVVNGDVTGRVDF